MTVEELIGFYPQFAGFTPAAVLAEYVRQANSRFSSFTAEDAEEARRLYAAHRLTMYARAAPSENAGSGRAAVAAAGQASQRIAAKKAGEVSVTYATGVSSASVSAGLEDLTGTAFGLQLIAFLRLYGRPAYVP